MINPPDAVGNLWELSGFQQQLPVLGGASKTYLASWAEGHCMPTHAPVPGQGIAFLLQSPKKHWAKRAT